MEDEALIIADIISLLTEAGFLKTSGARDFNDALKEFKAGIPDLVICDINLGNGNTGIDFIQEIHKIKPVPVIFLTGLTDAQTVDSAFELCKAGDQ